MEKIYIPSILEINNGYFVESQQTLDYTSAPVSQLSSTEQASTKSDLININQATIDKFDTLTGVD